MTIDRIGHDASFRFVRIDGGRAQLRARREPGFPGRRPHPGPYPSALWRRQDHDAYCLVVWRRVPRFFLRCRAGPTAAPSDVERHTHFGKVVGVDDSRLRHLRMERRAVREAARGRTALEGARRSRPVEAAAGHAAVRQRLCAVRAHLRPRREQPLRRDHRHDAEPGGRQRGLPVPEHLAPGQPARRPARDRLRARRQQRVRLHRRPGLRRRRARQGGACRRRDGELPPRHLRLPEPAAAQVRHGPAWRTRATSRCSTSSRR